jgi:hypothetical protein
MPRLQSHDNRTTYPWRAEPTGPLQFQYPADFTRKPDASTAFTVSQLAFFQSTRPTTRQPCGPDYAILKSHWLF